MLLKQSIEIAASFSVGSVYEYFFFSMGFPCLFTPYMRAFAAFSFSSASFLACLTNALVSSSKDSLADFLDILEIWEPDESSSNAMTSGSTSGATSLGCVIAYGMSFPDITSHLSFVKG